MRETFATEGSSSAPPINSRPMGMLGGSIFDGVNSVNRNHQSYLGYFDPSTAGVGIDASAVASHITENFLLPVPEPAGPLLIGSAAVLLILHRRSSLGRG